MSWTEKEFSNLKAKERKALNKLYTLYKDKVYNYLLIKTRGNVVLSEDILSETIHTAINSVHRLRNANNILSWLLKIAKNKYYDTVRKSIIEQKYINKIKQDEAYTEDYTDKIVEDQKTLVLNMAMEQVKPKYKDVLTMKYLDELSQKDIAQRLNKNVKAVESLLTRARNALKNEITKLSKNYFD